jgi:hypothetical protein
MKWQIIWGCGLNSGWCGGNGRLAGGVVTGKRGVARRGRPPQQPEEDPARAKVMVFMKTKNKNFGLKMIVLWALAYIPIYKIGGYVAEYIINFMGKDAWIITYPVAGMAMGLVIGLLQWLLLFRFGVPFWWVVASVIAGLLMLFSFGYNFIVIAIFQSFVLYWYFSGSGLWILAHILITMIQYSLYNYMDQNHMGFTIHNVNEVNFVINTIVGTCGGIMTGISLYIILGEPKH